MHIISRAKLVQFEREHPDAKVALAYWYKIIEKTNYNHFNELKSTFPSADKVGKFTVFNIGGNKFRLIAAIHFNRHKVYIRHILTHKEYDLGKWNE